MSDNLQCRVERIIIGRGGCTLSKSVLQLDSLALPSIRKGIVCRVGITEHSPPLDRRSSNMAGNAEARARGKHGMNEHPKSVR